MDEVLRKVQKDRATMISKLLGLPEVKQPKTALLKAKALLKNLDEVRSDCLCENDTAWKKIIQLSLKESRSTDDAKELAFLMAQKRQSEYLAAHSKNLHLLDVLPYLDNDVVEQIRENFKLRCQEGAAPKRGSLAEAQDPELDQVTKVLVDKLERAWDESRELDTAKKLRDLYTEQKEIQKLMCLFQSQPALLDDDYASTVEEGTARCLAQEFSETHNKPAALSCLTSNLATFSLTLGKRCQAMTELAQACEYYRLAHKFDPDEAVVKPNACLCEVLLELQRTDHFVDKEELREVLALASRWQIMVQLWPLIGGPPHDALRSWQTQRISLLAEEAKRSKESSAADIFLYLSQRQDAEGSKQMAFESAKQAYTLGASSAQEDLARLALEVGRVKDATDTILKSKFDEEAQSAIQACMSMMMAYSDQARGRPGRPEPSPQPEEPSPASWSDKAHGKRAGQLREQHPGYLPTICSPAVNPLCEFPMTDFFKKPWKFLQKEEYTVLDLKKKIEKRLSEAGTLPPILGSASELRPPLADAERIGRLFERHQRQSCLHLHYTLDKLPHGGTRLELFAV